MDTTHLESTGSTVQTRCHNGLYIDSGKDTEACNSYNSPTVQAKYNRDFKATNANGSRKAQIGEHSMLEIVRGRG